MADEKVVTVPEPEATNTPPKVEKALDLHQSPENNLQKYCTPSDASNGGPLLL